MKKLKIGFTMIIAILGVAVTLAAHAGVFKKKAATDPTLSCWGAMQLCDDLGNPMETIDSQITNCFVAKSKIGRMLQVPLFEMSFADCQPETDAPFCCAAIAAKETPCPWFIVSVYCHRL